MPNDFVVDTHAIIWFLQGDLYRLGTAAHDALHNPESILIIPAIVLGEASQMIQRGKTSIPSTHALLKILDWDKRWSILNLDRRVIEISGTLTGISELHDRLIVASTLRAIRSSKTTQLITNDQLIRASGHVPTVW